jgi:tripartite-type tricarboxylate transporter receptor subunit TctC
MVNFGLTQLTEDVEWDLREFSYYSQVAFEFRGVAVGANTDIETWDDYLEAVQNEELKFASTGPGSGYVTVPGVIGDIGNLYDASNVMDNQVIYDGRGEAVQGILAGDAQVMSGSYFSILPYVESGDLRMIMACTTEDSAPEQTPDAETFQTAGVENGQDIVNMLATRRIYAGPPNQPDEVVQANVDAYTEALTENDDLLAEAEEADRPIVPLEGPEAQEAVAGFIDNWSEREELLSTLYGL